MSFPLRLKEARINSQISQEALAELVGVSRQSVAKWEAGNAYPEMQKALILSAVLDVDLDWLFAEELSDAGRKGKTGYGGETAMLHKMDRSFIDAAVDDLYHPAYQKKVPTGFPELDAYLHGGLTRGMTYHIFGAPAVGKTTLSLNMTDHIISNGGTVLCFLKSGNRQQMLRSLIAISANVSSFRRKPPYTEEEKRRIETARDLYEKSNLIIDDSYDDTIEKMREKCMNLYLDNYEEKIDLIIIQGAELLRSSVFNESSSDDKFYNMNAFLQEIGRECRCPVLLLFETPALDTWTEDTDGKEMFEELIHSTGHDSAWNLWGICRNMKRPPKRYEQIQLMIRDTPDQEIASFNFALDTHTCRISEEPCNNAIQKHA